LGEGLVPRTQTFDEERNPSTGALRAPPSPTRGEGAPSKPMQHWQLSA
jgi:hypothetical protein